ncbi:unnamed protein product [Amoebophrya sp. A25]|nr:unnamed protein product [Amoebophrya sp. A25]|eukprot:GSA25T00017333001.1
MLGKTRQLRCAMCLLVSPLAFYVFPPRFIDVHEDCERLWFYLVKRASFVAQGIGLLTEEAARIRKRKTEKAIAVARGALGLESSVSGAIIEPIPGSEAPDLGGGDDVPMSMLDEVHASADVASTNAATVHTLPEPKAKAKAKSKGKAKAKSKRKAGAEKEAATVGDGTCEATGDGDKDAAGFPSASLADPSRELIVVIAKKLLEEGREHLPKQEQSTPAAASSSTRSSKKAAKKVAAKKRKAAPASTSAATASASSSAQEAQQESRSCAVEVAAYLVTWSKLNIDRASLLPLRDAAGGFLQSFREQVGNHTPDPASELHHDVAGRLQLIRDIAGDVKEKELVLDQHLTRDTSYVNADFLDAEPEEIYYFSADFDVETDDTRRDLRRFVRSRVRINDDEESGPGLTFWRDVPVREDAHLRSDDGRALYVVFSNFLPLVPKRRERAPKALSTLERDLGAFNRRNFLFRRRQRPGRSYEVYQFADRMSELLVGEGIEMQTDELDGPIYSGSRIFDESDIFRRGHYGGDLSEYQRQQLLSRMSGDNIKRLASTNHPEWRIRRYRRGDAPSRVGPNHAPHVQYAVSTDCTRAGVKQRSSPEGARFFWCLAGGKVGDDCPLVPEICRSVFLCQPSTGEHQRRINQDNGVEMPEVSRLHQELWIRRARFLLSHWDEDPNEKDEATKQAIAKRFRSFVGVLHEEHRAACDADFALHKDQETRRKDLETAKTVATLSDEVTWYLSALPTYPLSMVDEVDEETQYQ